MTWLSPLTDDEKRRRLTGVLQDGEYLGADVMFMRDSAGAPVSTADSRSDPHAEARMLRDAAHAARYGDAAAAARLAELTRVAEAGFADVQRNLSDERRNAWRGDGGKALRDAARDQRYS